jgi:hypothetical protein
MSALLDARAVILAALEAAAVASSTNAGSFAAPCVLVEPGDPWTEPQRLPGRLTRWRLTAVAGRADAEGALELLGGLVDQVDAALRVVPGLQLPAWSRPLDRPIGGDSVRYGTTSATVQLVDGG